jgi:N-carbamoyl-L-amino-acid hydrolase
MEGARVIEPGRLAARLRELDEIGVRPDGVSRLAWTDEDAACRRWFQAQAGTVGLRTRRDPAGNLWGCPDAEPPWWGVGSHLDSVRAGGRFDGPLGVVCGLEIAAAAPSAGVAVVSFADEEGARFNTPTFGSRALAGRLEVEALLERRDDAGVALGDALHGAGVDPRGFARAPGWLDKLSAFVEIHIDQTTELARAGVAVGLVRALVNRVRLQVELRGRADHAGTTPREERRDALGAAARLIVAADALAEAFDRLIVTTARIVAEPNAPTTIAHRVRMWVDARSPHMDDIDAWHERLRSETERLAQRTGVQVDLQVASRSPGREFDAPLRARLADAARSLTGQTPPEVLCFAGHDAGVLAERLPAAMVLVRNPTGVSHASDEAIDLADAALAAEVVRRAIAGS